MKSVQRTRCRLTGILATGILTLHDLANKDLWPPGPLSRVIESLKDWTGSKLVTKYFGPDFSDSKVARRIFVNRIFYALFSIVMGFATLWIITDQVLNNREGGVVATYLGLFFEQIAPLDYTGLLFLSATVFFALAEYIAMKPGQHSPPHSSLSPLTEPVQMRKTPFEERLEHSEDWLRGQITRKANILIGFILIVMGVIVQILGSLAKFAPESVLPGTQKLFALAVLTYLLVTGQIRDVLRGIFLGIFALTVAVTSAFISVFIDTTGTLGVLVVLLVVSLAAAWALKKIKDKSRYYSDRMLSWARGVQG